MYKINLKKHIDDITQKKRVVFDYLFLSGLILFHLINNAIWLFLDTCPPAWDESAHLCLSLRYLELLLHPTRDLVFNLIKVSYYYPPFFHLSLVPVHLLFGISADWATMSLVVYFAFLIIGVYKIGSFLYCRKVGLLAAFLVSMYQSIIYMSRFPLLDLPLTAVVTWGIYFLLRSRCFKEKKYAIAFGVISGIGLLVKWTYLFFIFFPVSFAVFKSIKEIDKKGIKNFLFVVVSFFIITAPWYLYNLVPIIQRCFQAATIGAAEGDPHFLSINSFLFYFWNLEKQVQFLFFILFLTGITKLVKEWKTNYQNRDNLIILIGWIVVPYFVFTLIGNKDGRYTLPFLPAVSIISAFWVFGLKKEIWQKIVVYSVIIIGLLQCISFSCGVFPDIVVFNKLHLSLFRPPCRGNWKHKEIFDFIMQINKEKKDFVIARVLANHQAFSSSIFRFYTESNYLPIMPKGYREPLGEFSDYLLLKTKNIGPAYTTDKYLAPLAEMEKQLVSFTRVFSSVGSFPLPDGSEAIVYKKEALPAWEWQEQFSLDKLSEKIKESFFSAGISSSKNFHVEIIPYNDEESLKGNFEKIIITGDLLNIEGIEVSEMRVELDNIHINFYKMWLEKKLVILSLEKIKPRVIISGQSLEKFIYEKVPGIKDVRIKFGNEPLKGNFSSIVSLEITGKLRFLNRYFKAVIKGKIKLDSRGKYFYTQVDKIKCGFFRIPHFIYASSTNQKFPLLPTVDWPVETVINVLEAVEDEKLIIKAERGLNEL